MTYLGKKPPDNSDGAPNGDAAAAVFLANPAADNSTWFAPGQMRGQPQKDAYFYLNIVVAKNVTYKDYARQRRMHKWRGRYKF